MDDILWKLLHLPISEIAYPSKSRLLIYAVQYHRLDLAVHLLNIHNYKLKYALLVLTKLLELHDYYLFDQVYTVIDCQYPCLKESDFITTYDHTEELILEGGLQLYECVLTAVKNEEKWLTIVTILELGKKCKDSRLYYRLMVDKSKKYNQTLSKQIEEWTKNFLCN